MLPIFKKIAELFKGGKPSINAEVSVKDESRRNKKTKKNKRSIDQSVDNSTQIAGDQYNNDSHDTVYVGEVETPDLVVSARWNHLVPHKIVNERSGIDSFNVLQPVDSTFRRATFSVKLTETYDEHNAIYVLIQRNPYVKNLKLNSISVQLDSGNYQSDNAHRIIGLLDTPKSFTIDSSTIKIGTGEIELCFGFEREGRHYNQNFIFMAKSDSSEFIIREYNEPELDIDWTHFSF